MLKCSFDNKIDLSLSSSSSKKVFYNCTSVEGIFRIDIEQIETIEIAIPKGTL